MTSRIEWDEFKSDASFPEPGFDFAYVTRAFADPQRLIRLDVRLNYGETRFQLIGKIEGRHFVVVYTPRSAAVRIISARKANRREVRIYEHRQEAGQAERKGFVEHRPH